MAYAFDEPDAARLVDFFLDVVLKGADTVTEYHLHRWTNRQRVTPSFWEIILEAWHTALKLSQEDASGYRLFVGENTDTYSFLAWDGGDAAQGGWWESVDKLASEPQKGRKARSRMPDTETTNSPG
jgi:hypothetical protein